MNSVWLDLSNSSWILSWSDGRSNILSGCSVDFFSYPPNFFGHGCQLVKLFPTIQWK